VLYAGKLEEYLRINLYPGFIRFGRFSPGLFLMLDRHKEWTMGIHWQHALVGLAWASRDRQVDRVEPKQNGG